MCGMTVEAGFNMLFWAGGSLLWKKAGVELGLQPVIAVRDKRLSPVQSVEDSVESREVLLFGTSDAILKLLKENVPPGIQA